MSPLIIIPPPHLMQSHGDVTGAELVVMAVAAVMFAWVVVTVFDWLIYNDTNKTLVQIISGHFRSLSKRRFW